MKISAVICELNPLHFGHRRLFALAKGQSDALVCILSGNFVQRGEPAILDKWARCRLALENGADLVMELPLPWACAGAERFAAGGVHLACALGNVDELFFGSEEPELERLNRAAEALLSQEFSRLMSRTEDSGETFARRREQALAKLLGEEEAALLRAPNAILGVEYLKALKRERSPITPRPVLRIGAGHDERSGGEMRSAGELRELLAAGKSLSGLVPESTDAMLKKLQNDGRCPALLSRLEAAILCKLREKTGPEELEKLPDLSEGLEHRLYQASRQAGSLEELYTLVKSKRYTHARIRRLVMAAFLGLTADLPPLPPYLRVLGMTERGEQVLREASPSLPIAVRPADFQKLGGEALSLFLLEARADDLYGLALPAPAPCGRDFTEKLIKPEEQPAGPPV